MGNLNAEKKDCLFIECILNAFCNVNAYTITHLHFCANNEKLDLVTKEVVGGCIWEWTMFSSSRCTQNNNTIILRNTHRESLDTSEAIYVTVNRIQIVQKSEEN